MPYRVRPIVTGLTRKSFEPVEPVRIRALRLAELIQTSTAHRPARQLAHSGSADGLVADVQTRRALSV